MRRVGATAIAAAAAVLPLVPVAHASDSHVDGRCSQGAVPFNETSATGPVSNSYPLPSWPGLPTAVFDPPPPAPELSAQADASSQAMHALAYVQVDDTAHPNDCTVNARIRDTVTALPGGGLQAGDVVRLVLRPGFHAQFSQGPAGVLPRPPASLTSVDAFASLELTPIPPAGCSGSEDENTCFPDPVASFGAQVDRTVDATSGTAFDPDGSLTVDSNWAWELHSNIAPDDGESARAFDEICPRWPACNILVSDPRFAPLQPLDVATGQRAIPFEVKIGQPVSIDARLNALVQAYSGAGSSGADMLRTFQFSLAPAPGYEGVTISYQSQGGAADTSAPEIACDGPDGAWHRDNLTVTCTATDGGSGLANPADDSVFELQTNVPSGTETGDGTTDTRQVCDKAGNCATAAPVGGNMIDRRPPVLSVPADVTADATGPAGARVSYSATAADGGSGVASVTCLPAPGSTFPVGLTGVDCTATDGVGNADSRRFTVRVKGAKEQLQDLAAKVVGMLALPNGVKAALLARVQAIIAAFDPNSTSQRAIVCNDLRASIAAVRLLAGHGLTPAQAAGLVADATRIRAVLAC